MVFDGQLHTALLHQLVRGTHNGVPTYHILLRDKEVYPIVGAHHVVAMDLQPQLSCMHFRYHWPAKNERFLSATLRVNPLTVGERGLISLTETHE